LARHQQDEPRQIRQAILPMRARTNRSTCSEISKNERSPQTVEEKFFPNDQERYGGWLLHFRIGIHKELHYKGNAYLKEFIGCTHPEHQ